MNPKTCPRPDCPGCPLLALPYSEQLEKKRELVVRAFQASFGPASTALPEVLPVRPSPRVLGYRSGAKLALSRDGKGPRIGIYERGSHRVIELSRCPVHHPLIAAGIRTLRSLLARAPSFLSSRIGAQGWLRYAAFQVSELEGTLHLTLVTRSDDGEGLLRSLAARLEGAVPEVAGVAWNVNPSSGNEIFGPDWRHLRGEGQLRERLGELVFRASPPSFLQANREQAGWVYRTAPDRVTPLAHEDALDLYSGVGGLALHLAPHLKRIMGIEGSEAAVADAALTARSSNIQNASFVAGRVEEALPGLVSQGFHPSLVSLNPPRKGADPSVLRQVLSLRPRSILYVSCNPETLARDASLLCAQQEYGVSVLQPVDFFPQTEHVETVAVFRRNPLIRPSFPGSRPRG